MDRLGQAEEGQWHHQQVLLYLASWAKNTQLLEYFWLGENSDRFAVEKEARRPMDDTHRVLHVVFGPLEMGIPIRRRRALMAGLNRRTMVWTGPQDPAAIQAEFESLFKRTCELSGDVFFWQSRRRCISGSWSEQRRGNAPCLQVSRACP